MLRRFRQRREAREREHEAKRRVSEERDRAIAERQALEEEVAALEARARDARSRGDELREAGELAAAVDSYDEVIAIFRDVVARQGSGYNLAWGLQAVACASMSGKGEALRGLGRPEEAVASFDETEQFRAAMAEQAGEEDGVSRGLAAEALLGKARALADMRKFASAMRCCDEVLTELNWRWAQMPPGIEQRARDLRRELDER